MIGQDIEQEIQTKGLTAPRVTPADIEAEIAGEHYFTAADGVRGDDWDKYLNSPACLDDGSPLNLLTFCVLVLRNGFTVTGESACASPENFDAEIGRKIARQNAVAKIWPLLGFRLRDKLAAQEPRVDAAEIGIETYKHFLSKLAGARPTGPLKFRKKPVVIEAVQYPCEHPALKRCDCAYRAACACSLCGREFIETLEGRMVVSPGDWIIKGVAGEFYLCKPDIFAATHTYESAE